MLRLDLYHYGSGIKVRLHDHPYARDDRCGPECENYATERSYPSGGESPRDRRHQVAHAAQAAIMARTLSHRTFLDLLADQPRLDLGD